MIYMQTRTIKNEGVKIDRRLETRVKVSGLFFLNRNSTFISGGSMFGLKTFHKIEDKIFKVSQNIYRFFNSWVCLIA